MHPVIECLAGSFRVIALDLPGFGESPVPGGAWGTADYAQFVVDLMTALDVERAHFVGHSFGGKTSLYVAATHADRVDKLLLVATSGLRSSPSLKVRAKRGLARSARVAGKLGPPGAKLRDVVYARIASQDYREAGAMRPIFVKVVNEDLNHLLARVRASTLLVWGRDDDAVPIAHARRMESAIPDAGLVILDGAGHFPYLDQAAQFCRVALHFLRST